MANIQQEQHSIRNMQVVSSNHIHPTHSCEANKCLIFKPVSLGSMPASICDFVSLFVCLCVCLGSANF